MQKLDTEYVKQLRRENVLALDVATHCGWRMADNGGTWHFPKTESAPKKLGPDYAQHKAFRTKLIDTIIENDIKVVAAEDVVFGHFIDFRKLCELRGVLFEVCESLDIPVIVFKPSDIKKFATGNGNADKDKMIEACINRWHITPIDDNEADATHIFFYLCKRYDL